MAVAAVFDFDKKALGAYDELLQQLVGEFPFRAELKLRTIHNLM